VNIDMSKQQGFSNMTHPAYDTQGDDLAEDNIPASDIAIGTDHWTHIFQQRKNFVRKYTRHADKDSLRCVERVYLLHMHTD